MIYDTLFDDTAILNVAYNESLKVANYYNRQCRKLRWRSCSYLITLLLYIIAWIVIILLRIKIWILMFIKDASNSMVLLYIRDHAWNSALSKQNDWPETSLTTSLVRLPTIFYVNLVSRIFFWMISLLYPANTRFNTGLLLYCSNTNALMMGEMLLLHVLAYSWYHGNPSPCATIKLIVGCIKNLRMWRRMPTVWNYGVCVCVCVWVCEYVSLYMCFCGCLCMCVDVDVCGDIHKLLMPPILMW